MRISDRHPDIQRYYAHFSGTPVQGLLRPVAAFYLALAETLIKDYPDGPEMVSALRLLLHSRDDMLRHVALLFRETNSLD